MRIVLIGQAAFGEKVLEALLEEGEDVVAVFCPPDRPDKSSPLRQLAEDHDIPAYQPARLRDPKVYGIFEDLAPDLNVMAFVTEIVPKRILDRPACGTIQYHPSLLPRHRGGSAIQWAIIQGDTRTGLTIFWPDEGIDTGPILLEREVTIEPADTTGSLYFNKLFPLGVEAMVEAVQLVQRGIAPHIPQSEAHATYEPLLTEEHTHIDWEAPADHVFNLIRGADPQPGAVTCFREEKLKIYDCERRELPRPAPPGQVLAIEASGFLVAGNGGAIFVKRVRPGDGPKVAALEFVKATGLEAGDRLG